MTHDDWRGGDRLLTCGVFQSMPSKRSYRGCSIMAPAGHIAFTASFAGLVPNAGLGAYGVAKYGVVSLAGDTGPRGQGQRYRGCRCSARLSSKRSWSPTLNESAAGITGLSSIPDVAKGTSDAPASAGRQPWCRRGGPSHRRCDHWQPVVHPAAHRLPARSVRRRFERIDRPFDVQAVEGCESLARKIAVPGRFRRPRRGH